MIGIAIDAGGFELCGLQPIGRRRPLDPETIATLEEFSARYGRLLATRDPAKGLLALGRELYDFLNRDSGDLTSLIDHAPRPIHFEIATPTPRPNRAALALLRAPWELLANEAGFLAGDDRLGFFPVRRLGPPQPPAPPDNYRLGVLFMAASPHGVAELDYEAEETAIIAAVGAKDLDLLVEESGNPKQLADRIAELPPMQAFHLSCHGHNAWSPDEATPPCPIVLLENEAGDALPTPTGELIQALRAKPPRLMFLSACLTASGSGEYRPDWDGEPRPAAAPIGILAQSLAESMIDGGFPAVLGWDGSVADRAASAFATTLYQGLAERRDLADAVASARRTLLNSADEVFRANWHLARLYLGPNGGGALVGGGKRRNLIPTHGEKEFLVKASRKLPVAAHDMFVGRRRELQTVLRALRDGNQAGVLLHGMGRLGKSSLAARIANRRPDLKLAVVFETYGPLDILAALEEALHENGVAREVVRQGQQSVRNEPVRFEDALIDLLCHSSTQAGDGGTPVLLLIDDLERILNEPPPGETHRIRDEFAPTIAAVLRAFDRTTDSRLILTSRFPFVLNGQEQRLVAVHLAPPPDIAQCEIELRQKQATDKPEATQDNSPDGTQTVGAPLIDNSAECRPIDPQQRLQEPNSDATVPSFKKHLHDLKQLEKELHPRVLIEIQRSIMDQWLRSRGLSSVGRRRP